MDNHFNSLPVGALWLLVQWDFQFFGKIDINIDGFKQCIKLVDCILVGFCGGLFWRVAARWILKWTQMIHVSRLVLTAWILCLSSLSGFFYELLKFDCFFRVFVKNIGFELRPLTFHMRAQSFFIWCTSPINVCMWILITLMGTYSRCY